MTITRPEQLVVFDEKVATRIYQRHLPHWRQSGVTYFVTFRLADSLPDVATTGMAIERSAWLKKHGIAFDGENGSWKEAWRKLPPSLKREYQQHFSLLVQSCLDRGAGECHLKRSDCIHVVRDALAQEDGESHHLGDWVVMPNHVHLLITPCPGHRLEDVMRRLKGRSAIRCNRLVSRTGPFWQSDSYNHIVRSLDQLYLLREYIAQNPVKAGITLLPGAIQKAAWMNKWFNEAQAPE